MEPRLFTKYKNEIIPQMMEKFGYKNSLQVPRLQKIVVNMGIGAATADFKILEKAAEQLAIITGQKALITRAKKAIANFKIRKGSPIGCKVTLRKNMMYEFLDRLVNVAIPRIRDFRGISNNSFDRSGNFALGLNEQSIFPEIEIDKIDRAQGMNIVIVTNAKNKDVSMELLRLLGMPFKK